MTELPPTSNSNATVGETNDEEMIATKLSHIFASTTGSTAVRYSIEIAAKNDFNFEQLERLTPQPVFCALPWISDENLRYADDFTRSPTVQLAQQLHKRHYSVLSHVSCYNITEQQVDALLSTGGIRNLFVIRGDTVNPEQTFQHSSNLVQYLRKREDQQQQQHRKLTIAVGGYPYGHHQSTSQTDELRYLSEKISIGADFLLTQTLYDADSFLRYRDSCRKAGISVPIIPGIYVPHSYRHLQIMLNLTRIELQPDVRDAFEAHAHDEPDQFEAFMVEYFAGVVRDLLTPNVTSSDPIRLVHFFTFNKFGLLQRLLQRLDDFFK